MQSIKNKLHLGHKDTTPNVLVPSAAATGKPNTVTTTGPASASAVRETEAIASTLPHGSTVERIEQQRTTTVDDHLHAPFSNTQKEVTTIKSIPIPPPAPAVWAPEREVHWDWHKYDNWDRFNWSRGSGFTGLEQFGSYKAPISSSFRNETLPSQVFEKPVVVHEEIRREQVEEIQPVINIEKLKTEVHQVTQPLFDKEIKAVNLQQKTLAPEVLPEVQLPGRGSARAADYSTVHVQDRASIVVEKPAIYTEVDKLQVIEEIQPVLYKETVIPTVIQETKPVYQKIVEGANYSQETLAARDISVPSANRGYVAPDMTPQAPTLLRENLPAQVLEKPVIIHEEVRREQVEEIQPVVNIEKLKTEVHQVTQPLFDKEIKAVNMQQRTLATEILPEVILPGRGVAAAADVSTVRYQDAQARVIEKPALVTEIDKLQVIEEIQPVVYKETIIPTVIQETKPVYQKIVEGTVYVHETLPARDLNSTQYRHLHTSTWTEANLASNMQGMNLGAQNLGAQNLGAQNLGAQNLGSQGFGTQNLGAQNLGTQNLGAQNLGQNLGSQGFGTQNLGAQNLGAQNLGSQNLGAQNLGSQGFGTQNLGAQNLGAQNLGTQGFGTQNFGQNYGTGYAAPINIPIVDGGNNQGFAQKSFGQPGEFVDTTKTTSTSTTNNQANLPTYAL